MNARLNAFHDQETELLLTLIPQFLPKHTGGVSWDPLAKKFNETMSAEFPHLYKHRDKQSLISKFKYLVNYQPKRNHENSSFNLRAQELSQEIQQRRQVDYHYKPPDLQDQSIVEEQEEEEENTVDEEEEGDDDEEDHDKGGDSESVDELASSVESETLKSEHVSDQQPDEKTKMCKSFQPSSSSHSSAQKRPLVGFNQGKSVESSITSFPNSNKRSRTIEPPQNLSLPAANIVSSDDDPPKWFKYWTKLWLQIRQDDLEREERRRNADEKREMQRRQQEDQRLLSVLDIILHRSSELKDSVASSLFKNQSPLSKESSLTRKRLISEEEWNEYQNLKQSYHSDN